MRGRRLVFLVGAAVALLVGAVPSGAHVGVATDEDVVVRHFTDADNVPEVFVDDDVGRLLAADGDVPHVHPAVVAADGSAGGGVSRGQGESVQGGDFREQIAEARMKLRALIARRNAWLEEHLAKQRATLHRELAEH